MNEKKLAELLHKELEKSDLQFTIDRSNFIRGWNARSKYDDEGNENENPYRGL